MSSSKNLGLPDFGAEVSASICKRVRYSAISSGQLLAHVGSGQEQVDP